MVIAQKESLLHFWKRAGFEGGERENDLLVHAHCITSHFFFLNFLSFLLCFLSYLFFSFLLLCFLFTPKMLCFSVSFSGHGKDPFIVPAMTNVLPLCPLTAFVWSGRTCRPPSLCDIHPYQTKAGLFRSSVYHNTSFLPRYKCFLSLLSRHTPNGSPSNLPLLGGLSSQQDVPPKRA